MKDLGKRPLEILQRPLNSNAPREERTDIPGLRAADSRPYVFCREFLFSDYSKARQASCKVRSC